MLDLSVAAAFKNIQEAGDIGVDVIMRVIEGVADAGLRGKMNDPFGSFLREDLCHGLTIGDILLDELKAVAVGELFEPGVF